MIIRRAASGFILIPAIALAADPVPASGTDAALIVAPYTAPPSETSALREFEVRRVQQRTGPGISYGSQVGFGLSSGVLAVGGGLREAPSTSSRTVKPSLGIAAGFGDPNFVAFDLSVGTAENRRFGDIGAVSAKVHRRLGATTSLSLGAEQFSRWGIGRKFGEPSYYTALSHILRVGRGFVAVSGGVGDNRFEDLSERTGYFGSLAWSPNGRYSLIADWSGFDLNAGVSVIPVNRFPLSLTAGVSNLLETDGRERMVGVSAGVPIRY